MEQIEQSYIDSGRADAARATLHHAGSHTALRALLALHVPALIAAALLLDAAIVPAAALLVVPAALAVASGAVGGPSVRAAMVATGLAWCSWLLVLWTSGSAAALLHGVLVVAVVGLYRDRLPLAIGAVAVLVLHLGGGLLRQDLVHAGESTPIASPLLRGVAIAAMAGIVLAMWRTSSAAERTQAASVALADREALVQRHQQELAVVYATTARRNQGLLERQIEVIEQLEADEDDPAVLEQLFKLDHLSTRLSREGASMLVLAGGEPNRRVTGTPPLSEVVRGAIGEIEDYTRVDMELDDDRDVDGRIVAALVHLLSELIENAASYSPPGERVSVVGATTSDGGYRLRVIDRGIGLDDARMHQYNHLLANPPADTLADNQRLGLVVVARLAGRHALPVQMSHNGDGRGVTATVQLPGNLLSPASGQVLDSADDADPIDAPATPAAPMSTPPDAAAAVGDAPVPAGVAGSPRWASATSQAGSSGGGAPNVPTVAPAEAAPAVIARPAAPRPVGAHATARSSSTWSYGGHLERRAETPPVEEDEESRLRVGRGSRSQIAGLAPRPADLQPAPPTQPTPVQRPPEPDRAPVIQRPAAETPQIGTAVPGDVAAPPASPDQPVTGRPGSSQIGTAQPADQGVAADEPTRSADDRPRPTVGAPATADRPQPGWAAATQQGGPPQPARPTAAELLQDVGEGAAPSTDWEARGAPLGAGAAITASGPTTSADGPAESTAPPVKPVEAAPTADAGSRSGLPQRRRGESLPKGLRAPAEADAQRSASAAPVSREQSRSLLSSYQSRLQAGRTAAEDQMARNRPADDSPAEGDTNDGTATDGAAGSNDST